MDKLKAINKFINIMWQFIKAHEVPAQSDQEAWDKIVDDSDELMKDYKTNDPMDVLFRMWMVAVLEYMSVTSKGMPTLMQECREVMKEAG